MAKRIEIGDSDLTAQLQAYFQSGNLNFLIGSGASMPAVAVASDIESKIDKLLSEGKKEEANRTAQTFIQAVVDGCSVEGKGDKATLTTTTANYTAFVQAVDRILFERKTLLLPRQANVFTTNYDPFIERGCRALPSVILNDGFERSGDVGSTFTYAPERYFDRTYRSGTVYARRSEMPTINLIKLHGCLTWRKAAELLTVENKPLTRLTATEQADAAKVEGFLKQHFLILPNILKFHSTLMERVYYDQLRMFANSLERENALLIAFGFSFRDEHILELTRRALRNPTAQLLIVAHDRNSAAEFETKFAKQRNALIIEPAENATTKFPEFNALLASALPQQTS